MNTKPRSFSSARLFLFAFFVLPSAGVAQVNLFDIVREKVEDEIGKQIEQGVTQQQQSVAPQQIELSRPVCLIAKVSLP